MHKNIQSSLNSLLLPENLTAENSYFCNVCSENRSATVNHYFSKVGSFLIIQLKRFANHQGQLIKDLNKVECSENIFVPVIDGEITSRIEYKLIGTVNHTGNLNRGHYTSFINVKDSDVRYFCNDAAVLSSSKSSTNNTSSYIYFYQAY